jgi:hypothetical protein
MAGIMADLVQGRSQLITGCQLVLPHLPQLMLNALQDTRGRIDLDRDEGVIVPGGDLEPTLDHTGAQEAAEGIVHVIPANPYDQHGTTLINPKTIEVLEGLRWISGGEM